MGALPIGRVLLSAILRFVPINDPWKRVRVRVAPERYGSGVRHDFTWFLEGDTSSTAGSVREVLEFLESCEYASDQELFAEPDYWQHPRTFESLKRGDCEDFALWAWRRLIEIGFEAELIVGWSLSNDDPCRHAWLVFQHDGREVLCEPTRGVRADAIVPLNDVRTQYVPEFGVDRRGERFAFSGYLYMLKHPELKRAQQRRTRG